MTVEIKRHRAHSLSRGMVDCNQADVLAGGVRVGFVSDDTQTLFLDRPLPKHRQVEIAERVKELTTIKAVRCLPDPPPAIRATTGDFG